MSHMLISIAVAIFCVLMDASFAARAVCACALEGILAYQMRRALLAMDVKHVLKRSNCSVRNACY